jgi:hypothetical protein
MRLVKVMAPPLVFLVLSLLGCGGGGGGAGGGAIPDTVAPTVLISALTDNGSGRTVSANAADNVGVTRVEFLVDGGLVGTATTGPYSSNWNTSSFSNGVHTLTAKAFDSAGNVGTTSVVITLPISALMTTAITGNTAVGTVTLSGVPSLSAYGLNTAVIMPVGASIDSATPAWSEAVASITDPSLSPPPVIFGSTIGFGSGQVMTIRFSNVPNGAKPGDFGISLAAVLGLNFVPIQ